MVVFTRQIGLAAVAVVTAGIAQASEGPFGVSMGESPDVLGCKPIESPGFYRCATLPKPHPAFEFYVVKSTAETGICWVKGIGTDINTNPSGSSIRSKVDDLKEQVALSYGKPEHDDWLMSGSIWGNYEDWMMGLLKEERIYAYKWSHPSKNDLILVYLGATASNSSSAYPVVEFSFSNKDKCDELIKKKEAGSF
ncbi:UNVERIFIED_ORG: hypothetical protein GGI57_004067 [Rhizobium aethiopicum]